MSGIVGIAPGQHRVALAIREGDDGRGFTRSIGDGVRHLVPAAAGPGDLWGSAAARSWLATRSSDARPADHLTGWSVDPYGTAFLGGLARRIAEYLGGTAPGSAAGWTVCVSCPDERTESVRSRARDAGLGLVNTVSPTDALVSRWCTDPGADPPASGRVIAVACGEASTDVAEYRLVTDGAPHLTRFPGLRVDVGGDVYALEVAREVLGRCREGVSAEETLSLLDGASEFADALRDARPDEELTWNGGLSTRMFTPLRFSAESLAARPSCVGAAGRLAGTVARLVASDRRTGTPLILLGGPGAVWPAIAAALRPLAPVRVGAHPAHALAVGATYWPQLRTIFTVGGQAHGARGLDGGAPGPAIAETGPPEARAPEAIDPEKVPPWERDRLVP